MYDWNVPADYATVLSGTGDDAVETSFESDPTIDSELEAAIEYKLAVSGFAGVAEIVELLNRSVRRRWV